MRWLSQAPYSGSEIGQCYATAHVIKDSDEGRTLPGYFLRPDDSGTPGRRCWS